MAHTHYGDSADAAERNVKIACNPRILAILLCALTLLGGLLDTRIAGAAPLDHFAWSAVSSPQGAGAPFSAALTANDDAGNLVSNYSGNITVSAEILSVPPLVISEVDNGNPNQVEFTNPSTNSIDVSGWKVAFYDLTKWPQPRTIFTIPAGTICPPQSVFVIAAGGVAPGLFPMFLMGSPLAWNRFSGPVAVSLLNQTNGLVDFFCASTGYPYLISNPVPILPAGWFGGPVPLNANLAYTYQRQGDFNQRQALNWIATNRSIGILNSNLDLPFTPNYTPIGVSPGSVFLTNGVWSGLLTVDAPGSNVILHADNGNGNPGVSNPFDVVNGTSVVLSLPGQTSDTTPGIQPAAISIPSAIGIDLVFNLASSVPSKIGVPATIVIAAGTTSTGFNLTNFNDSILDGVQLVTITASNYLFPPAQGIITNFSAPVQLELALPNEVNQQVGAIVGHAQLSTGVPVGSNFQAELFSSDLSLLATPSFVSIPVGGTNTIFNLSVPNGPQIVGSREVTVTAFAGPGATASGSITVTGQPTNLTLLLPGALIEGAGQTSNATVAIAGILPTNLTVGLTSSDPAALQVPVNVVLPAGQTSVVVPMTVPSNSGPGPDLLVTVSASAPGFVDANGSVTIQDNHLDHFAIAGIPLTQTANQPFAVSILAQNQSGDTLQSYSGVASLFPIGLPGGSLVPAETGSFTNGLWSGTISITTAGTNVMVGAQDGSVSGQSNPFDVEPVLVSTLNGTVGDLVYDPGTDRIYATIPASAGVGSNSVMRLNPYTASVEAFIPVDTNPGLMTLTASNEYIYIAVQSGYSLERLNLASQTPDLEFPLPQSFFGNWVGNMMGLPNSPASIAVFGQSTGISQDYIFDGNVARTNLTDLALVPGLDSGGILSDGIGYLPSGFVLAPTNQQPIGQFQVPGTVSSGPVAPDPNSGSVFFLSQQGSQTVIYAYNMATFALQGSQTVPGVVGTAQNLVRWGTNGLAFSTTGGQIFLIHSSLCPGPSAAQLSVSQTGPALAAVGSAVTFTITVTNSGSIGASDVVLYDPLPPGTSFVSANSSQGIVQINNGILVGLLGTIPSDGATAVTLTVTPQKLGILTNTANIVTSTLDSNSAKEISIWLTTVNNSTSGTQIAQSLLPVNDVVFNPANGKLYASVSGTSASFGNCIVAIDPLSLQISNPIAVGSEPGALALSQDGRYLYVYLKSSVSIELVDLQMDTVTFQYQLAYSLGLALTEMFVLPGGSHSLLFSQYYTGGTPSGRGVQIITDGVTRMVPAGGGLIQPSLASNVFYCYDNADVPSSVSRVVMNGTNAVSTGAGGLTLDTEPEIRSAGDLLFFSSGEVIDPDSMIHLATFPGLGAPPYLSQPLNQICPDLASGRVYYLISNGSVATIAAYSLNNYQLTGTFQVTGIVGTPEQLVRWGTDGFAFATTGGQVFSFQAPMVPTNQPADLAVTQSTPNSTALLTNFTITITVTNQGPGVATGVVVYDVLPTGMRFVSASSTQGTVSNTGGTLTALMGTLNAGNIAQVSILLRPDVIGSSANYAHVSANEPDLVMTNNSSLQTIAIATNISWNTTLYIADLVYDPSRGKVFATVEDAGAYSNSIVQIDPGTGNVEQSLPTSFTPGKITITSDGQFLYVGDDTDGAVARVNIQAWTNDLSFSLGSSEGLYYNVGDFAPLPGQPHSIAVSMDTWYGNYNPQVAIFDDGISRLNTIGEGGGGTYYIQASPDASTLYVVNPDSASGYAINPLTFIPYAINSSGIGAALTNLAGYSSDFRVEDNLLITDNGQALNLQNYAAQGTFPVTGLVAPDLEDGNVYFLVQAGPPSSPASILEACSTNRVNTLWQFTVPGASGIAHSLVRCGPGTFAFATTTPPGYPNGYPIDQFNQLFFLRTSVLPATGDLVLGVTTNWAFAGGYLINTFTILNDGQYFNATGVSFTNVLASGSIFVSATSTQGTCVQSNGVVTCAVGSMTGGSTVTITVVSIVPNAGLVPLKASVSKNEPDLDPSNNQISLTEMIHPPPSVTVSNPSVYRQSGVTATFNIVLASPSTQPVSLYCYTTNGSAVSPRDYLPVSTTLTIQPGATNANLTVTIENNGLVESNVVFYLNVSVSPSAAPIATGTCTLINNNFYSFSVTNISLTAGPGGITNAVFSVRLSGSNYTSASVDYFTRDGTAASGRDYAGKAGTLVFPSGVTNQSLSIPVYAIADSAPTKTFYLILANPVNAVLGVSQATASILNPHPIIGQSQLLSDGRFQLTVNGGASGQSYVLLASTNLVDWAPISGFVDTNPPVTIYDPDAAEYHLRFYRIGPESMAPAMQFGLNSEQPFNSNRFNVVLNSLPGLNYEIQASTNLVDWTTITNFVSTNSPFSLSLPTATNARQEFYRAVLP